MNKENNITQEQLERIERYLNHTLTSEERAQLEREMSNDPDFAQQVDDVRHMLHGIESAALKNKLDDFHDDLVPVRTMDPSGRETTQKLIRFRRIIRYVAAAVVVIGFGSVLFLTSNSPSEKLFALHFTPDPGLPTTMGASNNFEFYDAMVNYKQGDYKTAIKKWDALLPSQQENDTLQYFLGVAHLANGNDRQAILILKELASTEENSFQNETNYYLGMAYLKDENVEEAKKYLIFSGTERANKVLSELND